MGKTKERATRVVILIAVAGFIFSSAALTILAIMNSNSDGLSSAEQQQADLEKQIAEQQQAAASEPKEPLSGHTATPFDPASVTALQVEVLKEGDGPVATADSTVSANYFGWTSDGKIFDSSNKGGTATPVEFPLSGVIQGWTEGLTGIKQGSTVKLIIPADKAYGSTGSPPAIGPNQPLAFIVEVQGVK